MPKINFQKIFDLVGYLCLLGFSTLSLRVFGAAETRTKYVLLEPTALTGVETSGGQVDLVTYLKGAYQTFFVVVFSAAIIMIVWSGFEYILTDVIGTKIKAKERLKSAFFGLGIVALSYLVLYIINQDLVEFNLDLNI